MARKPKTPPSDDAPATGDWIVTFSDCMTLLLCFFVLLLTFSSFEEVEMRRLAGAFEYMTLHSIFPNPKEIKSSVVPPVPRQQDQVERGADTPQDEQWDRVQKPKATRSILSLEAYKDRRRIIYRSPRMFHGESTQLTQYARDRLATIARFWQRMPCRIVVSETSRGTGAGRAAVVVRRFIETEGVSPEYCFVTRRGAPAQPEYAELTIELLSLGTY